MGRYRNKLEEAVKEFQPAVEGLFDVSLGNIEYEPFLHFSENPLADAVYFTGMNILGGQAPLAQVQCLDWNASGLGISKSKIQYNNNLWLDILPKSSIDYIAVHEMAHLGHARNVGVEDFFITSNVMGELFADYAAHNILGLMKNPRSIIGLGNRPSEHAVSMDARLKTLGKDFIDYIKNYRKYEPFLLTEN